MYLAGQSTFGGSSIDSMVMYGLRLRVITQAKARLNSTDIAYRHSLKPKITSVQSTPVTAPFTLVLCQRPRQLKRQSRLSNQVKRIPPTTRSFDSPQQAGMPPGRASSQRSTGELHARRCLPLDKPNRLAPPLCTRPQQ